MTAEDIQYVLRWPNVWGGITQNIIYFICTKWCPELLHAKKLFNNKEGNVLPVVIVGNDEIIIPNRTIMEIILIFILFLAMITKGTKAMLISLGILMFMPTKVIDS